MIIETESTTFGIIVEKLISDQEIVHKKLAPPLYKVKHISGITTLANGVACLILSVLPPPPPQPLNVTTPSATACTGVPFGAA